MKKYYLLLIPLFLIPIFILAQSYLDNITYPIEELGNCQNKEDCSNFCDKIVNLEACFNFSRDNNLLEDCDLGDARNFLDNLKKGVKLLPCESKTECLDYCSSPANLDQCIDFAEKSGLLLRDKALLFKRIRGMGPGECKSREECKNYCAKEENVDECLAFAKEYGFMTQEQVAEAIRLRDVALAGGPGGCVGLAQCRDYCSSSDHFEECINFGEEKGIITSDEIEEMQEFLVDGGPGGCRTRQECDLYCSDSTNGKFCWEYMIDKGYFSKENIESIEENMEEVEKLINDRIEEYKKQYNIRDEEIEEIKRQIEEELQPFKDILNKEQ